MIVSSGSVKISGEAEDWDVKKYPSKKARALKTKEKQGSS